MKKLIGIIAAIIVIAMITACSPVYIFYPVDVKPGDTKPQEKPEDTTPTNPWGNDDKVFSDDFSGDTAVYYCPLCYTAGSTADHASHTAFTDSFVVEDGKATVYGNSAWLDLDADKTKKYTLSYTVELATEFGDGDIISFNFGETTGWAGVFAGLYNDAGTVKATSQNSGTPTAFIGSFTAPTDGKYVFTFTAAPKDAAFEITASINGTQIATTPASSMDDLYWNIYYPTTLSDSALGYITDFSVVSE